MRAILGAKLPFVGYRTSSTSKIPKGRNICEDRESELIIKRFVEITSHPAIRRAILSDRGCLYNPNHLKPSKWLSFIEVEDDADSRPNLRRLIEFNDRKFTLVVPGFDHIMKGNLNDATALNLLMINYIPVIDAQQALIYHGNIKGHLPEMGIERWIDFIREKFMNDRSSLLRSCLARFGANGLK